MKNKFSAIIKKLEKECALRGGIELPIFPETHEADGITCLISKSGVSMQDLLDKADRRPGKDLFKIVLPKTIFQDGFPGRFFTMGGTCFFSINDWNRGIRRYRRIMADETL